jgi:acyl-CoA oxidase
MIAPVVTTSPKSESFDPAALQRLLDGRYRELREQIKETMCRSDFEPPIALPTPEYRELVLEWAKIIAREGLTAPGFPEEFGGRGDPGANIAGFETIAFGDLSLLVKFGVQFGLWGGAIHQLGTRRHHERYLKPIATLELPGCFAMTESGHGSNVQALETTAKPGSSLSTHRPMMPPRTTSATPRATGEWRRCSRN